MWFRWCFILQKQLRFKLLPYFLNFHLSILRHDFLLSEVQKFLFRTKTISLFKFVHIETLIFDQIWQLSWFNVLNTFRNPPVPIKLSVQTHFYLKVLLACKLNHKLSILGDLISSQMFGVYQNWQVNVRIYSGHSRFSQILKALICVLDFYLIEAILFIQFCDNLL
jgi:hypothetical protein